MVEEFLSGLIKTNKTHDFFVDWQKARNYQDKYRDELALLQVLSKTGVSPEDELERLLKQYPRLIELIPLLAATRVDKRTKKIDVVDKETMIDFVYSFSSNSVSQEDITQAVYFSKKTGLLGELTAIKNPSDYYFGVEVGMDTNARKNRSGDAMENLIEPYALAIAQENNGQFLKQTTFEVAARKFKVKVPPNEANKKGDFMLFVNNHPVNIEVNYFDGGGSKQEIMNSYIPRAESLRKAGWTFVLVTDGPGWLKNKKQIELGYKTIKNILNAKMCKEGKLAKFLKT
jgi:type II restriction enzyme